MRSNLLGKKYKCPIKKSKYKPNRGELAKKIIHLSSDEHTEGIYQSLRKLSNLAKVTQLKNN